MTYLALFPLTAIERWLALLLQAVLVLWLAIAARHDWRERLVPLRYSNPLFVLGVLFTLAMPFTGQMEQFVISATASAVILWAHSQRWLNHADTKLQIALWGLWPSAAWVGMATVAVWGLGVSILRLFQRERFDERCPMVVPLALGAGLTFGTNFFIIFFNEVQYVLGVLCLFAFKSQF